MFCYNVHMSTLKNNTAAERIALLARKEEKIFHIKDLANLWLIQNKNTLRKTLNRYVERGLLHRIYRGFYSLVPVEELDPVLLGAKAIHEFCYLSTESVLFREGYLSQKREHNHFVRGKAGTFALWGHQFISRQMSDKFLYNSESLILVGGVKVATVERAIADMLYFNPKMHFDRPVDWKKVRDMQEKVGYPLTPSRYDSSKTQ